MKVRTFSVGKISSGRSDPRFARSLFESSTMIIFLLLTILGGFPCEGQVSYNNYRLYKVLVPNESSFYMMRSKETEKMFKTWGHPKRNSNLNVLIAPEKVEEFMTFCNSSNLNSEMMMDDVQKYIDNQNPQGDVQSTFDWQRYHRLDVIYQWLDSLVEQNPKILKSIIGGKTYEGRSIKGVKLSFKKGNPGIFIESGIHAREWIAPATTTFILNELIYSEDSRVRYMAESYDWYIFPVLNPDGYEYTHTTDRLWRKSRQPYTNECVGADLNRNWGFHWGEGGADPDPCAETFPGSRAFSEIETKSVSEYIDSIQDKIFSYLSFHSFSQFILLPYGYTNFTRVENYEDLLKIGNYSAKALSKRYGTNYTVGNIVDLLYIASGSSLDWVRGTHNIPITYGYELRDEGQYGFLLPADQIIPTGEETLDSLVAMFQKAAKLGYGTEVETC